MHLSVYFSAAVRTACVERSSSTVVRVWFMRMCRSMCLCCLAGEAQTVPVYEIHALVVECPAHLFVVTNTYRWSSSILYMLLSCLQHL